MSENKAEPVVGERPKGDFIIALVTPIGVDRDAHVDYLTTTLDRYGYTARTIKVSDFIREFDVMLNRPDDDNSTDGQKCPRHAAADVSSTQPEKAIDIKQLEKLIRLGAEFCKTHEKRHALAESVVEEIQRLRRSESSENLEPRCFIIDSIKRPEEIQHLRRTYGAAVLVLGISNATERRVQFLTHFLGCDKANAEEFVERDNEESPKGAEKYGQQTGKAYLLADAFLFGNNTQVHEQIERTLGIWFQNRIHTPYEHEQHMYQAFVSALSSGDLSRQVGAVLVSQHGDIVATGVNDAPKFGGGQYALTERRPPYPERDIDIGIDANKRHGEVMAQEVLNQFMSKIDELEVDGKTLDDKPKADLKTTLEKVLEKSKLRAHTEYSRAVHAEMSALMSCARSGITTIGTTLYCTTFPCHNCAKHLIAAGVARVVYVEPYPKSEALDLHGDALEFTISKGPRSDKMSLIPYHGIAARRFYEFFSLVDIYDKRHDRNVDGKLRYPAKDELKPLATITECVCTKENKIDS